MMTRGQRDYAPSNTGRSVAASPIDSSYSASRTRTASRDVSPLSHASGRRQYQLHYVLALLLLVVLLQGTPILKFGFAAEKYKINLSQNIMHVIKPRYTCPWPYWWEIPLGEKNMWFREWRKKYWWKIDDDIILRMWNEKASKNMRGAFSYARKVGKNLIGSMIGYGTS